MRPRTTEKHALLLILAKPLVPLVTLKPFVLQLDPTHLNVTAKQAIPVMVFLIVLRLISA
jgi:hypothetical protein